MSKKINKKTTPRVLNYFQQEQMVGTDPKKNTFF